MTTNREHNREVLKNCTHLARWGQAHTMLDGKPVERWMPVWIKNGVSFTPQGFKVAIPSEVKPATLDEILDYMDSMNEIAVVGFGQQN